MKDKRTEDIIRAYLAGEDSAEGKALFDAWYASFPDEDSSELTESDRLKLRQKMLHTIRQRSSLSPSTASPPRPRPWVRYRVAASVVGFLLLMAAGWGYYRYTSRTTSLATHYAEVKEVVLPDGSSVMLNANSTLRYQPHWDDQSTRRVWLEGEAFFSVQHTADHQPFVVHTPELEVNVLGTKFNVQRRRQQTVVVLSEGSIRARVPSSEKQVTLRPGDQVQHIDGQAALRRRQVDTSQYTAWKDQELVLSNTSLQEIATLLEDYYGLEVVLANDTLGALRVSSTHPLSMENPPVLLAALSDIFSLKATLTQKRIYLEPQ